MSKPHNNLHTERGFVALITILIITAVALIIGTSATFKALTHADMGIADSQSAQAWAGANACVEHALGELGSATTTWTSLLGYSTTLSVGSTTCYLYPITATGTGVDYRLIKATSTVGSYTRKLQVIVSTNTPASVISTWQEVGDF